MVYYPIFNTSFVIANTIYYLGYLPNYIKTLLVIIW